ncbi:MAG TPA: hypothetical protein VFC74_07335 [Oscillospiraceae bacterium]|nr:hypothetical protein [Oscillospiraceae bacterium]
MPTKETLRFRESEETPDYIKDVVRDIADHFKTRRSYLVDFCHLISRSWNWEVVDVERNLEKWEKWFKASYKRHNPTKIIDLVKKAFFVCTTKNDIMKIRGTIAEALLIGKFGGMELLNNPGGKTVGWGVVVYLNDEKVRYHCIEKKYASCRSRQTVDLGIFDGYHAKFYEVKVSPSGIGCKESKYLNELTNEMEKTEITFEFWFVALDSKQAIMTRLEKQKAIFEKQRFEIMGSQELSA